MSKLIEVNYQGKFQSTTKTYFNQEPPVTVNASRFTPIDLLAGAYGSCLMATIDYETQKKGFQCGILRAEVGYEMAEDGLSVGQFNIKIFFNEDCTDEQKSIIESAAKNLCHVGNSINPKVQKNFEFIYNH